VRATIRPHAPPLPAAGGSAAAGGRPLSPSGALRAFRLELGGGSGSGSAATTSSPIDVVGAAVDVTADVPARSQLPGFEAATRGRTVPGVSAYAVTAVLDGAVTAKATVVLVAEPDALELHVFPQGTLPGCDPATSAGHAFRLALPHAHFGKAAGASGSGSVKTPMPGKLVKVHARAGDAVAEGQPLLILEAMKMEHVIKAPRAGVLAAVHVAEGEFVEDGRELLAFQPAAGAAAGAKSA
jgi:biotin carboxyl carrier protein